MNIALIGYGNMGKELETLIAEQKKHKIVSISFKNVTDKLDLQGIKKADVAIDFTAPAVVLKNIETVAKLGTHMVIGTTGWYQDTQKVKKIVQKAKIGFIFGSNFSIGANLYFKLVEHAGLLFDKFDSYDVYGYEIHHKGKKDSPSGTAKKIADILVKGSKQKKIAQFGKLDRQIGPEELHFASVRGGVNPGRHEVIFDSIADEIILTHQAHGRRGFAEGAIMAAEFIRGKKGFYSFDDLFKKNDKKIYRGDYRFSYSIRKKRQNRRSWF